MRALDLPSPCDSVGELFAAFIFKPFSAIADSIPPVSLLRVNGIYAHRLSPRGQTPNILRDGAIYVP